MEKMFLNFLAQFVFGKGIAEPKLEEESKLESEAHNQHQNPNPITHKSRFICETCGNQAVIEVADCCFGRKFDCHDAFGFSCIGDLKRLCDSCATQLAAFNRNEDLDNKVQAAIDECNAFAASNASNALKPFLKHTDSLVLSREMWALNQEMFGDCSDHVEGHVDNHVNDSDGAEWGVTG
jgi:hypothetical protein